MRLTVITLLLFLNYKGLTQYTEFGISLGGSNYSGDLTENRSASIKQTHPCFGIHGRLAIDPVISLKLQYSFLQVSGDDKYSTRSGLRERNINFRSVIHEINLSGQMQFLNIWSEYGRKWSPYLHLGISVFKFNPVTNYQGSDIALQSLGTEGQGMVNYDSKYSLVSYALSFGFGLRYFLSCKYSLTIEAMGRKTATDYLDDASTNYVSYTQLLNNNGKAAADLGNKIFADTGTKRASPVDKDWYQSVVFIVSYHFGKNNSRHHTNPQNDAILCPGF